jgi:transposase
MDRRCGPDSVRRQKTDRRDAGHILKLLVEGRFSRIWVLNSAMRDLRKLWIHRHKLVQIRSRVKNELQHLMMNQGRAQEVQAVERSRKG